MADHVSERSEDASLPGSLPALRRQHIRFSKQDEEDLPARIDRLRYINPYGHEIWPVANPKAVAALAASDTVVYSIGSLYTSILPSVVLRGVGSAIVSPGVRKKVLILNASIDRETGPSWDPMTATDFVRALARAGREGIRGPTRRMSKGPGDKSAVYNREEVKKQQDEEDVDLDRWVTHLLYVEGDGAPKVHVSELEKLGVKCVKVESRKEMERGGGRIALRYDEDALAMALDKIVEE
jgi:hypothetical protein